MAVLEIHNRFAAVTAFSASSALGYLLFAEHPQSWHLTIIRNGNSLLRFFAGDFHRFQSIHSKNTEAVVLSRVDGRQASYEDG